MTTVAERVAQAEARQQQWEAELTNILEPPIVRFLRGVIGAATSALEAPTLLAAADPFAFTNIKKRWDTTVRLILHSTSASRLSHPALLDEQIAGMLRAADLPDRASAMAVDVLTRGRDEDWTAAKTKRELRAAILPPAPKVQGPKAESKEWAWHKTRVRAIARTAATRAGSLYTLQDAGYSHKRWMTRRDRTVRDSHVQAHGQTVGRDGAFMVGGYAMQYPGDMSAPPAETTNCRCLLIMLTTDEVKSVAAPVPAELGHFTTSSAREAAKREVSADIARPVPGTQGHRFFENRKAWRDSLTEDQDDAIHRYSGIAHERINKGLRGEAALSDRSADVVARLDSLPHERLEQPATLVRGLLTNPYRAGDTVIEQAYASTTPTARVARDFSVRPEEGIEGFMMYMRAPAGQRFFYGNEDEVEMILPRGTRLRVDHVNEGAREIFATIEE